jgi:hypothetical protein
MRAARWSLAGLFAAVALVGCATYPETYYYDDDRAYAGGDYSYGERWDDEVEVGYWGDGYLDRWSPAYSRYYTTILYPPYGRSYDPWYTPGWYYGTAWIPGAGWHGGWSGYRDPWRYAGGGGWWGYSGWYSPYRHGWYDPWYGSSHGWGYGYGGYSWRDQQRAWRDHERRYGRRGYEPSRRWGRDATASDEVARIARERDDRGGRYDSDRPGRAGSDGYRGGAPSAYDRREPNTPYGTPSRFGNPRAAEPPAPPQGRPEGDTGLRTYGNRNSGRVTAMPDGGRSADDGNLGERYRSTEADPRRGSRNRWSTEPDDRMAPSGADWNRPREETPARWSRPAGESYPRDRVYRAEPREAAPSRYEAPARFERPRYEPSARDESPARYEAPARFEAPSRNERSRFDMPSRDESPRFEAPSRSESPRFEAPSRSESPRFEMPSRNDSPRFEAPSRSDDGGASRRGPDRSDSEQQDR